MFDSETIKNLNELELILYKYIIKNYDKVIYMRIRELADETHVSTTTILRFCKKFNCNGYSEFKVKLKLYFTENKSNTVSNDNSVIVEYFKKLDTKEFHEKIESICDVINNSSNLVFLGSGTSGILCKYAARYFSALGKFASYIDDPFFPTNYKTYENFTIVVLSVSGETPAILNLLNTFKSTNCTLISITNSENCTISKISDLNISYYMNQEKIGISDVTTQVPVMYILESIAKNLNII